MTKGEQMQYLEALNCYKHRMGAHFRKLVSATHNFPYILHMSIRRNAIREYRKMQTRELIRFDSFINM